MVLLYTVRVLHELLFDLAFGEVVSVVDRRWFCGLTSVIRGTSTLVGNDKSDLHGQFHVNLVLPK
jgi:hypothetical protein